MHFGNRLARANPETPPRPLQTLCLDILHLVDSVVTLLAPLKLLIQKVQHREVQAPNVVPSRQVDVIMGV